MIYALYHNASETIGYLGDVIKELGLSFRDVHLYAGDGLPRDTGDLEGLIVMGGPMNVDEEDKYPFLLPEVQLIEKVVCRKKPVLGICLGAQLIATALGSKVYPNKHKEIGWGPIEFTSDAKKDPVLKKSNASLNVLHWHGDTFDLPKETVHLARSSHCENQAFRYGDRTYGFQFHLEVTPGMVRRWVSSKEGVADIKAAGEDPRVIFNESPKAFQKLKPHARKIFKSYLQLAFKDVVPVE
jgi:GMP synthase (glutamine-hydrolysing)